MGMESYSITVLVKGISIAYENSFQKLIGISEVEIGEVEERLKKKGGQYVKDTRWTYNDNLELFIYQQNGKFQGLEIKGCLSWLDEGVKDCFQIINNFEEWYGTFDIYVLGAKVWCGNAEALYKYIYDVYYEKIQLFNKQYNNIKLKATCGKFYKEVKRKNKWYYKLFHKI